MRRCAPNQLIPLLVLALAAGPLLACGGRGTNLDLDTETPLRTLRVGVLPHPERVDEPELDENLLFVEYVESLNESLRPFASVEVVRDPSTSSADVFLSLNLDVNYVKQVDRVAYIPKLLTLWLWNVAGMPNSVTSAHYHLSAVLYDRDNNILHAAYVHEPVTFHWKNIYWEPRPMQPRNVRFVFNRLLAELDRDMRQWETGTLPLGRFTPMPPALPPVRPTEPGGDDADAVPVVPTDPVDESSADGHSTVDESEEAEEADANDVIDDEPESPPSVDTDDRD